jgi:decaprenyl-phosphate phosphoribosyltransferase
MDLRNGRHQTPQPTAATSSGTSSDAEPTPAAPATPGLGAYVRLARPKQWLKNILVVAAPGAAGVLTHGNALAKTAIAFVCFCLAASGTYYINDALDVEADRLHPRKRNRPIASGAISVRNALLGGVILLAASIALSFAARWELAVVIGSYLGLTLAYSLWLKNEAVIDLAAVAAGFVLRMIAGGVAVGVPISFWFLIVAGSVSMFIVTGKRHAELLELGDGAGEHRRSLDVYSHAFLSYVRAVASSVAVLAYCLWAFERSAPVGRPIWFQLSIVPFVLAILRYALLLEQGKGGAPEELVLSDRSLQIIGVAWVVFFAIAVHGS